MVADQVDGFGQRGAGCGAEQVNRIRLAGQGGMSAPRILARGRPQLPEIGALFFMGGQHPRGLFADAPQQVMDDVAAGRIAQNKLEHSPGQHGAFGKMDLLKAAPVAAVLKLAIEGVGGLRDRGQVRYLLADVGKHGGYARRLADLRQQTGAVIRSALAHHGF